MILKRFSQAKLYIRLPILIVASLITCLIASTSIYLIQFRNEVKNFAEEQTRGIADQTEGYLIAWAETLSNNLNLLASERTTIHALRQFQNTMTSGFAPSIEEVRDTYISNNPYPLGERDEFTGPEETNWYDRDHAQFHDHFRQINEKSGYYDLFLITPDGMVIYSVYKEDDFATNVETGPYQDTGLGDAFRAANSSEDATPTFTDFAPYAPSNGAPAAFFAQKVFDLDGTYLGVVAFQMPSGPISEIVSRSSILRPNDEVYLLGEDGLARSNSRLEGGLTLLDEPPSLNHLSTLDASEGEQYFDQTIGLAGFDTVAFTKTFGFAHSHWTIVVERNRAEVMEPLNHFLKSAAIFMVFGAAASLLIGYFAAKSVTGPLNDFISSMSRVADEDFDTPIIGLDRNDEIGDLNVGLESFREKLQLSKELTAQQIEQQESQRAVVEQLANALDELASGNLSWKLEVEFPSEYETLRENFNSTVETMNTMMRSIVENANEIRGRAEEISSSSDDLSQRTESQAATLEETAAALDELTASIKEAAEGASEIEKVVGNARDQAVSSGEIVSEAINAMSQISKSSNEISQIIGVIDDIAFQTNLLSLNAGVEAARAGDAGRGFAVVASEVRALAQRSSEAAKQIKGLITSSYEQVETGVNLVGKTGDALGTIIDSVGNINELMVGIASGSREQSIGLGEINTGVAQLDQVTQQNAAMVEEATAAAMTLRNEAGSLSGIVAKFKLSDDYAAPSGDTDIIDLSIANIQNNIGSNIDMIPVVETPDLVVNSTKWTDF